MIFYSDKTSKNFTNDNFPLFLELKKLPASLISLKQQEIFLNEFAWNAGVTFDKRTKTHIFPKKFTINNIEIFYFKELERIENERNNLEKSGEMEFQKRLILLYEAQNNDYGYLSENEEKIIKFFEKQQFVKKFLKFMLWACFYTFLCYSIQIQFFLAVPIVIFIVVMIFGGRDWKYISNLSEDFTHGRDFMYSYFDTFYGHYLHPADILLFADVMNYFSDNILQRNNNIMENEKNFSKKYFFEKTRNKIQNFLIEEKIKLKNDAEVVQKIIQKWSELEKIRLEKERENSQNPLILASNKRREIMMKNLENINENL